MMMVARTRSRLLAFAPNAGSYAVKIRSYGSVTGEELTYRLLARTACAEDSFEVINAYIASSDPRSQLQDDRPLEASLLSDEVIQRLPVSQVERSVMRTGSLWISERAHIHLQLSYRPD